MCLFHKKLYPSVLSSADFNFHLLLKVKSIEVMDLPSTKFSSTFTLVVILKSVLTKRILLRMD